jgi:hypothetical protein
MSITVIDDVFTKEEIERTHRECLSIPCIWSARSNPKWKFWTGTIFNKNDSSKNIYHTLPSINNTWEKIKNALEISDEYTFNSVYINCSGIGNDCPLHNDFGEFTILYYTNPNWKIEWDGGTSFYNKERDDCIASVSYKAGRIVSYEASTPHKPDSISREADDIRVVLVIKLIKNSP